MDENQVGAGKMQDTNEFDKSTFDSINLSFDRLIDIEYAYYATLDKHIEHINVM